MVDDSIHWVEPGQKPGAGLRRGVGLAGCRVVVMGLGRFGGGLGVTRYLVGQGARVLVTDLALADRLADSLEAIADLDVELRLGGHDVSDLDGADLLVVSPAIDRRRASFFQAALGRGIPWTTEMNLFLERCPARILGVTGTIGKSTTCAMLHTILGDALVAGDSGIRRTYLGGNIGCSLLGELDGMSTHDAVVLELSSFQLDAVGETEFNACVVGLTNAVPHHLERHGNFDAYLDAKLNLLRKQRAGDVVVVGTDSQKVLARVRAVVRQRGSTLVDGLHRQQRYRLAVPGSHNQANAHLAVTMAIAFGVDEGLARGAVARFAGLPHRLAYVATVDGVRYYNDSKSTSAEAIVTALAAFDAPVVMLCGGKDIGEELDRLVEGPWDRARGAVCFGEAGQRLANLLGDGPARDTNLDVASVATVEEAATLARSWSREGDVVVLSPGCPSYDAFENYEQRGAVFCEQVHSWR